MILVSSLDPDTPGQQRVFAKNDGETTWTQIAADVFGGVFGEIKAASLNGRIWVHGSDFEPNTNRSRILSSTDGETWTRVNPDAYPDKKTILDCVPFNDKLIALVNDFPTTLTFSVWASVTGEDWQEIKRTPPFAEEENPHAWIVFHDRIYFISSDYLTGGKVWSSADGVDWILESGVTGWIAGLNICASFVYQNELWIVGTTFFGTRPTQVWKSGNGSNWQRVDITGFIELVQSNVPAIVTGDGIRIYHPASQGEGYFSGNGSHWQFFGSDPAPVSNLASVLRTDNHWFKFPNQPATWYERNNEVYYSENGTNWSPVQSRYGIEPVLIPDVFYFKNRIWAVSGTPPNTIFSAPWPSAPWSPASAGNWLAYP